MSVGPVGIGGGENRPKTLELDVLVAIGWSWQSPAVSIDTWDAALRMHSGVGVAKSKKSNYGSAAQIDQCRRERGLTGGHFEKVSQNIHRIQYYHRLDARIFYGLFNVTSLVASHTGGVSTTANPIGP